MEPQQNSTNRPLQRSSQNARQTMGYHNCLDLSKSTIPRKWNNIARRHDYGLPCWSSIRSHLQLSPNQSVRNPGGATFRCHEDVLELHTLFSQRFIWSDRWASSFCTSRELRL